MMERSDTIPPFQEFGLSNDLLEDSSFSHYFDSRDIGEIISSSSDEQGSPNNNTLGIWNGLDIESGSDTLVSSSPDIKIENCEEQHSKVASKKVICIGNAVYTFEQDTNDQATLEETSGDQFINQSTSLFDPINSTSPNYARDVPSLSLQPWKGDLDFDVSLETANHQSSKWVYSKVVKKLFLKPFEAVPIEIKVSQWTDAYINITPVYTSSEHNSTPVVRCPNHRMGDEEKNLPYSEHIVQVENQDAKYRVDDSRFSVDIPVGTPAPGGASKILYVKCGCWNTCTGGPSRKAFCLLFTLFSSSGKEIGRQVIQLKVCACPIRDCSYSEKSYFKLHPGKKGSKTVSQKKKLSSPGASTKRIKVESQEQASFELISVPSEIATEVKRCVNRLVAELHARQNGVALPFPEA